MEDRSTPSCRSGSKKVVGSPSKSASPPGSGVSPPSGSEYSTRPPRSPRVADRFALASTSHIQMPSPLMETYREEDSAARQESSGPTVT